MIDTKQRSALNDNFFKVDWGETAKATWKGSLRGNLSSYVYSPDLFRDLTSNKWWKVEQIGLFIQKLWIT